MPLSLDSDNANLLPSTYTSQGLSLIPSTYNPQGVSLGGFLAQAYASQHPRRVASLVLCNSFTSTASFADSMGSWVSLVNVTPTAVLRSMLIDNFPTCGDAGVMQANEWVKERLSEGDSLDG